MKMSSPTSPLINSSSSNKVGSTIVLKGLSILLGLFFIFIGAMKISPYLSKELHKDLRNEYVKYAKVFPLSSLFDFKIPSKWYRRIVGSLEIVCVRVSRKLNYMDRIRVYQTLIAPHFEYCPSVLFMCNESDFQRLQKLQNRAMRIILGCNRRTRINEMRNALAWMTVKERIYFQSLIFIFKMKFNLLPHYMTKNIKYRLAMAIIPSHKIKNAANISLLLLMFLAVYSHYMVSDPFERSGPAFLFTFTLGGRLVVWYQTSKREAEITDAAQIQANGGVKQE